MIETLGDVLILDKNNKIDILDNANYKISGVQNYGKGIVIRREVLGKELTMKKYQVIKENQLMWCKVDTKNGAFGLTKKEHIGSLASTNMALATIDDTKIIPEFVETLFKIKFFHEHITKYSSGSTNRKYLTPKQLFQLIEIPNLSLKEQENFIYKVKSLNNSGLYEEVEAQQTLLKKLRQSILQEAIEGKLTAFWREQNPNVESASVLLEKIKIEKEQLIKEKKIKKQKSLPLIGEEDKVFILPERWIWCRLQDITNLITDGKHGNCQDLNNSGYYFLSAKDIQNGELIYKNARQIIPDEFHEVHNRTNLEAGDICMVNTGATIGKLALASEHPFTSKTTFQKSVAIIKVCKPYINQKFVSLFLTSKTTKLLATSWGSAINNLLLGDLKKQALALPPLEEQKEIVKKIENLFKICDELETQINSSKVNSEILMQAVLKEAFEDED